jgi:hypothetical protein
VLTEPRRPGPSTARDPRRPDRGPGRRVVALSTELAPWCEPLRAALGPDGYSVVEAAGTGGGADVVLVTPESWTARAGALSGAHSPRVMVVAEPECARHDHGRLVDAVNAGVAAYVCGATPGVVAALIRGHD